MRQRPGVVDSTETHAPHGPALEAAWSFLKHAPLGVLAVSREGRVLAMNPAACRLLGHAEGEIEGDVAAKHFRAPRGEGHIPPGATAAPEEVREVEVVARSGEVLPIGLRLLPLESLDGALLGTIAIFQDLREQKAHEEQWRRRDRLASLGALSAGVAHEIRNPLAGIGTSAQVLKRRLGVQDPRAQFVDVILEEVSRLDRIVESLLQFARPASPKLQRQSVLTALEKALTLVNELAVRQHVRVRIERAEAIPDVYVDGDQLLQVLLNVLMNALQVLEHGGEIDVSVKPARVRAHGRGSLGRRATDRLAAPKPGPPLDMVEIRIRDNGPGVPASILPRVFDPFFTTRTQGTGLGLSICQSIIREHGGIISMESVAGQGATVIIDLPVEKRHGDRRYNPR
jgi:two-component system, NtrC family, nitrogen regulation sensor histidine kinase GlnL